MVDPHIFGRLIQSDNFHTDCTLVKLLPATADLCRRLEAAPAARPTLDAAMLSQLPRASASVGLMDCKKRKNILHSQAPAENMYLVFYFINFFHLDSFYILFVISITNKCFFVFY